jgi:cytochrome c oxidase subunit 1
MQITVAESSVNYLNHQHTVASWLLTKDHKRIGIMYMIVVTIAFALGGVFAALIRMELTTPAGDLMSADTYNRMFTMHGVTMVFFVLVPAVPAILGNFVMPLMIGAKDVAFPKLNLLSWYIFVIGFLFTVVSMILGGVDTGWTFYTPYSTQGSESNVLTHRHRRLHHRILVDSDRPQLHGDDSPDAGARNDLVPAAAVHLGAVFDQPGHGPRARR